MPGSPAPAPGRLVLSLLLGLTGPAAANPPAEAPKPSETQTVELPTDARPPDGLDAPTQRYDSPEARTPLTEARVEAHPDAPPELRAPELLLPSPGAERVFQASFGDALFIQTDLLLEGVDAEALIDFTVPAEWEILADPVVTLALSHSPVLLPERSHLTATLNGQAIGSVQLDATNGVGGQLTLHLPRALLQPYNHLRLRAVQHYGAPCEDPFDPGLWTRVKRTSSLSMAYRRRPITPDLARFPFPLFDATGYGPADLTLVLTPSPSAATIDAIGRLGVAFGRLADYRGVHLAGTVGTVGDADTHALLVGTWGESPEIRALLGEVAPRPAEGLVALVPNPADPTRAVLVVSGADEEGLQRAALAVASQNRHEILSGTQARVDFVADGRAPPHRRLPRPVPPTTRFSLADLGLADQTVRGFYTPAVYVPLELDGDAAFRPGGAEATVHYAYAAGLDPSLSSLEIRLDGVTVKSVTLDNAAGSGGSKVRVTLPDGVMTPRSKLEMAFTLFPEGFDACGYVSDETLWATVYADTAVEIERDRVAHLPDLARLRYGLWPFTLEPDAGAVIAALPDNPTAADVGAGFLLGAALGRASHATHPSFRLAPASAVSFHGEPDANFILLASGAPHALHQALVEDGALTLSGGTGRTLFDGGQRVISATVAAQDAIVEETFHPDNPSRATLVLSAAKGTDLRDLVGAIADPARVARLDGNVALVNRDGGVRTLQVADRRQIGTYPVGVTLVLAARQHWILLGIAIVTGAILFATVKRAWVRAREA